MLGSMRLVRGGEPERTPSLAGRAEADLRFIRGAMERSGTFTGVPGVGAVAMGGIALVAAAAARFAGPGTPWLLVWLGAALAAVLVGWFAMQAKAARQGIALMSGPGRRFLLCLGPSLVAGAVLTAVLVRAGREDLLPATWLLCYGAGVTSAGAFSAPVVPATGATFLVLGAACAFSPAAAGDGFLAAGFGVVHVVSGCIVARRHGG